MTNDRTAGDCPFLQPARPLGGDDQRVGLYCRLPDGDVRVPPTEDLRRYCVPGRWRDCPVYERRATRPEAGRGM